jgi:hypothetical protein
VDARMRKLHVVMRPNAHANGEDPATEVTCCCGARWTFGGDPPEGFDAWLDEHAAHEDELAQSETRTRA